MRNIIRSLALVVGLTPAIALGAIKNSKHDLSNLNTGSGVEADPGASGTDQTCIFCHTPHKASETGLLWNRDGGTSVGWGAGAKTLAGTTLPQAAGVGAATKRCLSCHDGTVALGNVMSKGNVDIEMVGGEGAGNNFITAAKTIGGTGNLMGQNHPVSVPYPLAAGGNSYNTITTAVTAANATAGFWGVSTTCTNSTGVCTAAATTGGHINLFGTAAAPGIECGTCHEVHNKYEGTNSYFLRVGTGQSAICLACHKK